MALTTAQTIINHAIRQFAEQADGAGTYDQDAAYTLLLEWLNELYIDVVGRTRCYVKNGTLTTVADTQEYTITTTFTDFYALRRVYYVYSSEYQYKLDRINAAEASTDSGLPNQYYQEGTTIGFYPVPNDALTMKVYYVAIPTTALELTSTPSLIPSQFRYILADGLTYLMFENDKGSVDDRAGYWKSKYESKLAKMEHYFAEGYNADMFAPI